jgi:hypothetical protein
MHAMQRLSATVFFGQSHRSLPRGRTWIPDAHANPDTALQSTDERAITKILCTIPLVIYTGGVRFYASHLTNYSCSTSSSFPVG